MRLIWSPVTPWHFAWQAWHKLTSTVVVRGTNLHLRHFAWQVWLKLIFTVVLRGSRGADGRGWRAWSDLVARDAAALCIAGVAQTHIYHRFAWQAWHKLTSEALCVAGVAQTHIYRRFAWQSWHKLTSTIVLRGRRGTDGSGWRAWSDLVARDAVALCVAGVAQTHIYSRFAWQVWHKLTSALSRTHVTFTHTIFHTQLCHTDTHVHTHIHTYTHTHIHTYTYIHIHTYIPYHTIHYITLHYIALHAYILSFHIPSCFVTHRLSHATLSHTTVLTSRSFTTSFVFPSFPVPATTFEAHY